MAGVRLHDVDALAGAHPLLARRSAEVSSLRLGGQLDQGCLEVGSLG